MSEVRSESGRGTTYAMKPVDASFVQKTKGNNNTLAEGCSALYHIRKINRACFKM